MARKVRLIAMLAGLAGAAAAAGQDPVELSRGADSKGRPVIVVTNHHSAPLTGLLVSAAIYHTGVPAGQVAHILDVYVHDGSDRPIAGGASAALWPVPETPAGVDVVPMAVGAAVFADGRRFGTEHGLRILLGRRRALLEALVEYRALLENGRSAGLASIRSGLDASLQAIRLEASRLPTDEASAKTAGGLAAALIKSALDGPPPPGCTGDCANERIDQVLRRLTLWEARALQGVREAGGESK